ncbi:class III signal peptide [Methanobrevibacter cuticularis]|uniref:Class III signal peptide n=1 Tax=Methanobrevibacter cuticularis TaxID=47311 RepID=A0A166FLI1_9EURY|nr:class III signal peptide-containing protein [Methanobrevibacter cuticularis]KZX17801.1 class III signal peptide [Methanobrevibacter cuticularis]
MKKIKIKIIKENSGQGSAEMILLIGAILVIVIVAGSYMINISESINNSLKGLLEKGRDSILNKL